MERHVALVGLIMIAIALGGCFGPLGEDLKWTTSIYVDNETEVNGNIKIEGTVGLGGLYSESIRIEDVSVCAVDGSGESLDSVDIGPIPDDISPPNYTFVVPEQPERIVLGYGEIETEGEGKFEGVKLTDEGLYAPFYQDGPRCNGS